MHKVWYDKAWDDYLYWLSEDKKTIKRINQLIRDIERTGDLGIGKPEILHGDLSGFKSRRINETDRLVYRLKEGTTEIASCRGHYGN